MTIIAEVKDKTVPDGAHKWPQVWCEEKDGIIVPHKDGQCPRERTPYTVLCEEINGVYYPFTEGGEPVVQGLQHFFELRRTLDMVSWLLADWPEAEILSDIFIYWQEGNPQKKCAPDLCVLPRVWHPGRNRNSIKLWHELSTPAFILELLSGESADKDMRTNFEIYQDEMKVPEYFIGDIRTEPASFQSFRLENGVYRPIKEDKRGWLWSEQLQGWFGVNERGLLQVWDRLEQPMPDFEDLKAERSRLEFVADHETRRAEAETRRAQAETRRAEAETRRADREAELRAAAEARIRELEEELRRRGG